VTELFHGRYTADAEGEFVVLLIGMRLNRLWRVRRGSEPPPAGGAP
jgi:hypothetical protein